ncbi:MAG TPA: hypothetical protein VNQ73_22645 [Ilumatobacter sp.]|nr:hypothetical protein [Ilumatobacter sp.]
MIVAIVLCAFVLASCSGDGPDASDVPAPGAAEPRQPTSDELDRFATARLNAYRAGRRGVDGVVMSDTRSAQIRGWIDTAEHWGYGMISGPDVEPFLALWDESTVSAQSFSGNMPPLPVPAGGWETTALDISASHLAAAQVLLVSLASDTPENPQLLRQNGVTWVRSDTVGQVAVDVLTGPVPAGATSSSFRYWIDGTGNLMRLEARLDGVHWSSFTFTDAANVELDRP